jgi:hypothetical protein
MGVGEMGPGSTGAAAPLAGADPARASSEITSGNSVPS